MARYDADCKKPLAVKEIEAIPLKRDRQLVVERITKHARGPSRPFGVRKYQSKDKYRVRQGRYRILYVIEDQDLLVRISQGRASKGCLPVSIFSSPQAELGNITTRQAEPFNITRSQVQLGNE